LDGRHTGNNGVSDRTESDRSSRRGKSGGAWSREGPSREKVSRLPRHLYDFEPRAPDPRPHSPLLARHPSSDLISGTGSIYSDKLCLSPSLISPSTPVTLSLSKGLPISPSS